MSKIARRTIRVGQKPTKRQINEIEKAASLKSVFDENSPEFSYEDLLEMMAAAKAKKDEQKKEVVTLRLSASALRRAKATGKGYTGFLSRLIENALNDKDLVSRSL